MRKKVSTLLDESLYRRAKIESALRGKQISEIIGEALEEYLDERGLPAQGGGIADRTWGAMRIPDAKLQKILAEGDWLDS